MGHQGSFDWIQLYIAMNLVEFGVAPNHAVEVLLLPERFAAPAQQLVGMTRGRPLHLAHQIWEPDVRRPKHVYMIRHNCISVKRTELVGS